MSTQRQSVFLSAALFVFSVGLNCNSDQRQEGSWPSTTGQETGTGGTSGAMSVSGPGGNAGGDGGSPSVVPSAADANVDGGATNPTVMNPNSDANLTADTQSDSVVVAACKNYPVVILPNPRAETAAVEVLRQVSPTAKLTWSRNRGSIESILQAQIPIGSCTGNEEVWDLLMAALRKWPSLFQIDPTEWLRPPGPYSCSQIPAKADFHYDKLVRDRVGVHRVRRDVITFQVSRVGTEVFIVFVSGLYLPTNPEIAPVLAACPPASEDVSRKVLAAQAYPFIGVDPGGLSCRGPQGSYKPNDKDVFTFAPEGQLVWSEDVTKPGISMRLTAEAGLVVDPSNLTPELLNSNVSCGNSAGWVISYDTVTSQLLSSQAPRGCKRCGN